MMKLEDFLNANWTAKELSRQAMYSGVSFTMPILDKDGYYNHTTVDIFYNGHGPGCDKVFGLNIHSNVLNLYLGFDSAKELRDFLILWIHGIDRIAEFRD